MNKKYRFQYKFSNNRKYGGDKRFHFGIEMAHTNMGGHNEWENGKQVYFLDSYVELCFYIGFWNICLRLLKSERYKT